MGLPFTCCAQGTIGVRGPPLTAKLRKTYSFYVCCGRSSTIKICGEQKYGTLGRDFDKIFYSYKAVAKAVNSPEKEDVIAIIQESMSLRKQNREGSSLKTCLSSDCLDSF